MGWKGDLRIGDADGVITGREGTRVLHRHDAIPFVHDAKVRCPRIERWWGRVLRLLDHIGEALVRMDGVGGVGTFVLALSVSHCTDALVTTTGTPWVLALYDLVFGLVAYAVFDFLLED